MVDESLAEVCTQAGAIIGLQTRSANAFRFMDNYEALSSTSGRERALSTSRSRISRLRWT